MPDVCRLEFKEKISKKFIESQISLAIITAECTFGKPRVRLSAAYLVTKSKAVIDVSNEVGEHIAQVFIGLMTRSIGENKFTVNRVKNKD